MREEATSLAVHTGAGLRVTALTNEATDAARKYAVAHAGSLVISTPGRLAVALQDGTLPAAHLDAHLQVRACLTTKGYDDNTVMRTSSGCLVHRGHPAAAVPPCTVSTLHIRDGCLAALRCVAGAQRPTILSVLPFRVPTVESGRSGCWTTPIHSSHTLSLMPVLRASPPCRAIVMRTGLQCTHSDDPFPQPESHQRQSGALNCMSPGVQMLVLDEADLLLSYGFDAALARIAAAVPRRAQALLFSATTSAAVEQLTSLVLSSPTTLDLTHLPASGGADTPVDTVAHYAARVATGDRDLAVLCLLRLQLVKKKVLLFVNGAEAAYRLKLLLEAFGLNAAVLHGALPLNSRHHAIQQFNRCAAAVCLLQLVCFLF